MTTTQKKDRLRIIFSFLMIIFGIAEVFTGFSHEFMGLVTTEQAITTIIGVILGICYFFSGVGLLIYRKWTLTISFFLLLVDIFGRLTMMISGMYPMDSLMQSFGIITGTLIAFGFAIYVFNLRKKL